jgi:hypothetical protein
MRLIPLLLFVAGCGGAPFSAELLQHDPPEASAPDAPTDGGASEQDAGDGQDAAPEAEGGQVEAAPGKDSGGGVSEAGPVEAAPPVEACVPTTHTDGVGQTWQDCAPVGTYTQAEAEAACMANGGALCVASDCGGSGSLAVCDVDPHGAGNCICWVYSGALVGDVNVMGGCTNALQASCNSGPPYTWQ